MKRKLRHPIRSITEPYGRAGLLVAILALVLATTGAAFAAGKLTSGQKKEVEKIAKKYAGKPGAPGATGPAGAKGENGAAGSNGSNGVSAEATSFTGSKGPIGGVTCTEGGLEVKSASGTTLVCNGTEGKEGKEGKQGEAGPEGNIKATLPSGMTETGVWAVMSKSSTAFHEILHGVLDPVSFNIPLAAEPEHKRFIGPEGIEEFTGEPAAAVGCSGSASEPTAIPGTLCIYTQLEENVFHSEEGRPLVQTVNLGSPKNGVVISVPPEKEAAEKGETIFAAGSWAVTAK